MFVRPGAKTLQVIYGGNDQNEDRLFTQVQATMKV